MDTTEIIDFVIYNDVSFAQGMIVDHAPLAIMLKQDCGPWSAVLIKDLLIFSL